ncbi:MAG: pseudouridine synthase [Cryomorphaceae bacterium]
METQKEGSDSTGQFRHFVLHKPHGYLSQLINNQDRRKNKKLLGELYDFPPGTMSIGRLDEKSEGLLLLTTNGKVSKLISSNKFEKEYYVQVDGVIDQAAIEHLKEGVEITVKKEPYTTTPGQAKILEEVPSFLGESKNVRDDRHGPTSWISITLTEGKFRQVRKMTAAVGFPTLRLVRVRIASTTLIGLSPGEVKEVDQFKL